MAQGTVWFWDVRKDVWIIKKLRFKSVGQLRCLVTQVPNEIELGKDDFVRVLS